ncbi:MULTISPECIES: restriction endonuclease subunit S [Limnospira]|uniref:TypeI R-M system restriction enzyme subunit S, Type I restriction enzyme Asp8005ORF3655 S protein (Asp8005ORF3665 S protein)Subunit S of type I restriction-modification system n=1 Tax=Limnospira indica PCC 8005 TaxID=376219 RepID=A0A9P1KCB6_9CYAN|nr:restriction endonuclease subunit S [Limnospira indica]CDM93477.1 TypeI R-M system restriction enzyme subunit S, Type I restriction enzyme Asp8005ORF3655 S protein (Asp8005ORF3665 S protein)Subunit S of type I restriction-modification system [Limnospira indica PCC 8005]
MSELPKGWDTTTFGNICGTGQYGWTTKASSQGDVKYLRTTDITKGQIEWDSVPYCQEAPVELDKYQIQENDILISRAGSVGFSVLIDQAPFLTVFASYLIRFVPLKKIEPYYVAYFLRSPEYWKQISEASAGIALANVNAKKLAELSVPLPPLNEQRRIVAKLDRLFARSRCAREELGRVSGLVQRYKQAVLAAAFRGDLTADWREENPTISMNNKLHDLDQARQKIWQENQILRGKDPRKIKYKKAVEIDLEGRTKGIEKLFELPETWTWISLGQIVWDVSDGPHFSPKYVDSNNGIPFISARNVKYSGIDFADAKYISLEDYQTFIQRAKPEVGDVLLTKGGTTGISTVVETDREFGIWVHIALLKIVHRFVIPEYLRDALSSSYAYQQSQAQTHGVGNQDLGLTRMVYIALTLPPIDEQQEIVRRVEKLFKVIDIIEQEHQKASKLLDRLEKATLSKAFRGELVPQDPNDEPAAVLLERIQAQRQTQPKRKAKSTRKPKAN